MNLTDLKPKFGSKQKQKRLGRGPASGHGKTCGRGTKGQNSRTGGGTRLGFEGGQMPLIRRVPKRGFTNKFKKTYSIVNLETLEKKFKANSIINPGLLKQKKIINKIGRLKILGKGNISKPLMIKAHAISKKAKEKVIAAGGKIELLS